DTEALAFTADGRAVRAVMRGGVLLTREVGSDRVRSLRRVDIDGRWMVPTRRAAFSARGERLATCGDRDPRVVKVYDAESGKETHALTGHPFEVTKLAISGDGGHVAASGLSPGKWEQVRAVCVWDLSAPSDSRMSLSLRLSSSQQRQQGHGAVALNTDGS